MTDDATAAPSEAQPLIEAGLDHHGAGRFPEAEASYRAAIEREPGNTDALHLLGLAALAQGRGADAVALLREALGRAPAQAFLHNNLGEALRLTGEGEAAVACYREALRLDPGYAQAHHNLGLALQGLGRLEEAAAALEAARAADPDSAAVENNLGVVRRLLGDPAGAVECFDRAVALAPGVESLNNLGGALLEAGRVGEAREVLERALGLEPSLDHRVRYNLAQVLARGGDLAGAEALLEAAIAAAPGIADYHVNLALVRRGLERVEESVAALEAALACDPAHPVAAHELGVSHLIRGRFAEAEARLREVIGRYPGLGAAWEHLSRCRRFGPEDEPLVEALEGRLAAGEGADSERAPLHFALAKLWDDCARHDRAQAHLRDANRLARGSSPPYDAEAHRAFVADTRRVVTPGLLAARAAAGHPSEAPVFIVGMPRSGAALVEQVLASHPEIHGGGERELFRSLPGLMAARLGEEAPDYPGWLDQVEGETLRAMGEAWLEGLPAAARGARRITDRMTVNFEHLGLIALVFPRARFVHCRREPRDLCLSILFQHFRGDHLYAYDPDDLAAFHRDYQDLMAHWKGLLGERILDLDYEALVEDLPGSAGRLLAHCGLELDPACLRFWETAREVGSASHWAVRQPLYHHAVGRWRDYPALAREIEERLAAASAP